MKTILLSFIALSLIGATADNGVTIHVPRSITGSLVIVDDQGATTTRTFTAPVAVLAACAHFLADTTDGSTAKYIDCADLILKDNAQTMATIVARYASDPAVAAAISSAASQPAVSAAISAAQASAPPPVQAVTAAAAPTVTVTH